MSQSRPAISPPSDGWLVLALTAAAGLVTAGPYAAQRTLYNDTLTIYSFFSDELDALARFGAPAYWFPHIDAGTPGYFYALLGQANLGRPAFVAIAAVIWALGRAGVRLHAVQPLYVFYFGFLIPGIFLFGVRSLAARVFRTRTAVLYALVVAAFSPGVLVNVADPGILENTGYALFCAAAFVAFVSRPDARTFVRLVATALLLVVAASQMLLAAAAPLLAVFAAAVLATSRAARRAVVAVSPLWWAGAAAALAAAVLPSAIAYRQQGAEITHAVVGDLHYAFGELKSGNPLQFLVGSVPGIAFDWDAYRQSAEGPPSEYGIRSLRYGDELGNNYLGLLATPLAAVGLVAGRRRLRVPLLGMIAVTAGVFVLYGASPVFAPFLVAIAPLRTLNHFGDMLYGGGAFLLVLFAAALGLETLERRDDLLARMAKLFPLWSVAALGAYWRWAEPPSGLLGFAAVLSACFAVVLVWASRTPRRTRARTLQAWIVALAMLDVATVSFWYLRGIQRAGTKVDESRFGRSIGDTNGETTRIASLYMLRSTKALVDAGVAVNEIPRLAGFCAADARAEPIGPSEVAAAFDGPRESRRLALAPDPALARFFAAPSPVPCVVQTTGAGGTYDEVHLTVAAAQPALLFLRNGWAPQWRATIGDRDVPIHRALGAFQAVEVPAGTTQLRLRFHPPGVLAALTAAYAVVAAAWLLDWWLRRPSGPIAVHDDAPEHGE